MARKSTRKTEEKELIKAPCIAIVRTKDTKKFLGFLVKSNTSQEYYQITCTKVADECVYSCNCPARVECCHIKAVKLVVAARKALNARKALTAKAAQAQAEAVEVAQETVKKATHATEQQPAKKATPPVIAAPKFVNKVARQAEEKARAEEERQKRLLAPLNGNGGFSLLMPVR